MPAHESLPSGSFTEEDTVFLSELEAEMRPQEIIRAYDNELKADDPSLYHTINKRAFKLAPDDLPLRGFIFTEMLLQVTANRREGKPSDFDTDWYNDQSILI